MISKYIDLHTLTHIKRPNLAISKLYIGWQYINNDWQKVLHFRRGADIIHQYYHFCCLLLISNLVLLFIGLSPNSTFFCTILLGQSFCFFFHGIFVIYMLVFFLHYTVHNLSCSYVVPVCNTSYDHSLLVINEP